jgi:hypothetical protein
MLQFGHSATVSLRRIRVTADIARQMKRSAGALG